MLGEESQEHVGRTGEQVTRELVPAVRRLAATVRMAVVGAEPVGSLRSLVAGVEGDERLVVVPLLVPDTNEPGPHGAAHPGIIQGEEREFRIVDEQARRNGRNRLEVGLERLVAELAAVPEVPQALGLGEPDVVGRRAEARERQLQDLGQFVTALDDPLSGLLVELVEHALEGVLHEPTELLLLGRHHPPHKMHGGRRAGASNPQNQGQET